MKYLLLVLALIFAVSSVEQVRYDNYLVISLRFTEKQQLFKLGDDLDIWTNEGTPILNLENEIFVSPKQFKKIQKDFETEIKEKKVFLKVLNSNYQNLIDEEQKINGLQLFKELSMTKSEKRNEFFKRYQTYPEIQEYLKVLHAKYPTKTQLDVIGKTFENRDIVALRVFSGSLAMEKRKGVFINSAQHAREWISPATTLYMVTEVLKRTASNDPVIKPLMEKLVIHYVPVVNPDGYIHSFVNRMWRKNRFRNSGGSYGVDLNRNFVWAFGGPGSSGVQSSETYRGASALSEKESSAVDKYLDRYNGTIKVGIDYHSFSQYLLRPWDYSRNPTDDEVALEKITTEWRKEIRSVHNFDYASMRGAQMYLHSGGIMDHFYGVKKFFGFCVELRPRSGGFVIDPKNIIPSGEENFKGLIVLLKYAATGQH